MSEDFLKGYGNIETVMEHLIYNIKTELRPSKVHGIGVFAIRDIKKGEELTCDYGFGFDENYKQFPCKCKSKNCCGYIVRSESRWRINSL